MMWKSQGSGSQAAQIPERSVRRLIFYTRPLPQLLCVLRSPQSRTTTLKRESPATLEEASQTGDLCEGGIYDYSTRLIRSQDGCHPGVRDPGAYTRARG